ncbi:MAG TPA: pitrilysin family protein [Chitinivibrionales bacterium]|nr:pitrilysin family protein [Chitinivibrionales bacterium]
MEDFTKLLIFAVSTFLLVSNLSAQVPDSPRKIVYPALDWKVPLGTPYRQVLSNGLVAYIAEEHSLPYFKLSGYVRYGSICDPAGKEGISSLMATLMRTGGTQTYQSDTLDYLIDQYALRISVSVSETQVNFSCASLSEYADTCLFMLSQILFHPSFEDKKIKKQTSLFLESIAHRFDNPDPILDAAYEKAMYNDGQNSRLPTAASVARISKKDIVALHKNIFKTENMIIAVSGDFSKKAMEQKLCALFPKAGAAAVDSLFPHISVKPTAKSVIVNKAITQSYIRMGLPLFKRPHDDYYAVQVLNLILGGEGFTSRLGSKVRSDEGLAYVVYSSAGSNYFYPSTFFIEFHTKNETAAKAMALSYNEVTRIRTSGVTAEELSHAKKVLIDALPSMFRTADDIVDNYAGNEYLKQPPDHFTAYPDKINALTQADIAAAAKKYLDPAAITYTVVGDTAVIFKNDTISGFSFRSQKPIVAVNNPDSLPEMK